MAIQVIERTNRAIATATQVTHYSVFLGDPLGAGVEVAGITRAAVSWVPNVEDGKADQQAPVVITLPAEAGSVDYLAGMTADTGGVALISYNFGAQDFTAGGQITVTAASILG